ncbi:tRNA (N6-threonylcarbamoyladenosine(37)-N6)-methyltransferase TrmO [Natrialbaceae archaeon AArc-T1-2]|uniref:tRNA (N6-threonylcarbamoyladenosine(37)-N6)-methyltransferase TrmO n=1 Tax=Natrialbaceae archaeon AArc-T1-2 TaxID=3053904 RepID=UPI00255B28CA|nr:tRNA (N6-threonylcarbamoyladenosine(37)-N6)-methyltransferase TrmO [Natrialbaceae archaeon AArc-T1-2]WIV68223.1 tRNA (N6-threonylcarbamoyladenosine(37)-N6)-methyltransferase TrmO [Natrialbaceae archaeon AArc-T1-2]
MEISYTPIGHVRSPHDTPADVAHDEVAETAGEIVLEEAYERGLEGLEEFSHVVVLAHLDEIDESRLTARPPHVDDLEVGVFATRSPHRPTPIAQTVVEVCAVDDTTLQVRGLDLVDGTPVLDLKPHVRSVEGDLEVGWLEDR